MRAAIALCITLWAGAVGAQSGTGGAIIGGVLGAAAAKSFGAHPDGVAAGAVLGAIIGGDIDRRNQYHGNPHYPPPVVYHPPPPVVYAPPPQSPGWVWNYHPHRGWGWWHHYYGWNFPRPHPSVRHYHYHYHHHQ